MILNQLMFYALMTFTTYVKPETALMLKGAVGVCTPHSDQEQPETLDIISLATGLKGLCVFRSFKKMLRDFPSVFDRNSR